MRTKATVKIILIIVAIVAVSVGGYSVYHYGQAVPVLHSKQPANGSETPLAEQAGPSDTPSATPLQVVAVQPSDNQPASSSTTPSVAGQTSPSVNGSQSNANPDGSSVVSPQAPALSLQTQPIVGAVQGVVNGALNGIGVNLQL